MRRISTAIALLLLCAGGAWAEYFVKLTSAPLSWEGQYLIVYEAGNKAFDGSIADAGALTASGNQVSVRISNGMIEATEALKTCTFTVESAGGNTYIQSASGLYIGGSGSDFYAGPAATYPVGISGAGTISSNGLQLGYSNSTFGFASSGSVQAVALYKLLTYDPSRLNGKSGRALELELANMAYVHHKISYNSLWTAYRTTDPGPQDSIPAWSTTSEKTDLVYDMYAWMKEFPKFYSDATTDASMAHSQTGGYNREHCVPNSWWGGESGNGIAYTDLHHLVPGDGAANNAKGNYALGEYAAGMTLAWPTETKTHATTSIYRTDHAYVIADSHTHEGGVCTANASHVWRAADASEYGGSACLYEPADEYKGDFARMYLYVVCAYEGKLQWRQDNTGIGNNPMFANEPTAAPGATYGYTVINDWAKALLLKWHRQDPVSHKERARNNAVESLQGNRNPFVDYPDFVEYIWGDKSTATDLDMSTIASAYVGKTSLQAHNASGYWATFSSVVPVEFTDEETSVYTVTVSNGGLVLYPVESKQVPAMTGVLLKSSGAEAAYTYLTAAAGIAGGNLLKPGKGALTEGDDCTFYKLAYDTYDPASKEGTGLGFYYGKTGGAAFMCKAGTAYLAVPNSSEAPAHFSLEDAATGIVELSASASDSALEPVEKYYEDGHLFIRKGGRVFNLQGMRVK